MRTFKALGEFVLASFCVGFVMLAMLVCMLWPGSAEPDNPNDREQW